MNLKAIAAHIGFNFKVSYYQIHRRFLRAGGGAL